MTNHDMNENLAVYDMCIDMASRIVETRFPDLDDESDLFTEACVGLTQQLFNTVMEFKVGQDI